MLASETSWVILQDDWATLNGRKLPSFSEAKEYIQLIEEDGFSLKVFLMGRDGSTEVGADRAARIKSFVPELRDATLLLQDGTYFALLSDGYEIYPDERTDAADDSGLSYFEGKRRSVLVNSVERSGAARAECIAEKGYSCTVCEMDFASVYGQIGTGFIHVHHNQPIATTLGKRAINPKTDLEPVCPNCHAMLHKRNPPFSVAEMKAIILAHAGQK